MTLSEFCNSLDLEPVGQESNEVTNYVRPVITGAIAMYIYAPPSAQSKSFG